MDEKPEDRQYANQYRDYAQRHAERIQRRIEHAMRRRHPPAGGLVVSAVIIVVGVLMLLDNFGIFRARDFWQFWPLIFVIGGIGKIVDSRGRTSGTLLGVVLISIGTFWILSNAGILFFDSRLIAPIILIVVGVMLFVRTLENRGPGLPFLPHPPGPQECTIAPWAIFGGSKRVVTTKDFRGGDVLALFGGVELDLRDADINGQATVAATAVFGGIEIRVPPTWMVETRGAGLFGGYEDKTVRPDPRHIPAPPKLILDGFAIFGGVSIKN
jgi:Domain of unknown function (DUF5668)/Cell wall-active antibiotics response 4TMS YvqF